MKDSGCEDAQASVLVVRAAADIDRLMESLRASAASIRAWIRSQRGDPLELLWQMKFEPVGRHPVEDRALNFV